MRSFTVPLCFLISVCHAQSDTSFVKKSITNVVKLYEISTKSSANLTGTAYTELQSTKQEHPYYLTTQWTTGSIDYEGYHYVNVPLRFDMVTNTLITESYNGNLLALTREKLTGFDFNGHHFLKLNSASIDNSLPKTAFYDVIYNGPTRVIASRQKEMQKTMVTEVYVFGGNNKNEKLYLEKYKYYILHANEYHLVSNKKSLLSILGDQKIKLKKFIRANRLNFKQDKEKSLSVVTAFYDSLKEK